MDLTEYAPFISEDESRSSSRNTVFIFLIFKEMDRVQKAINAKCTTRLSEAFGIEIVVVDCTLIVLTAV
jgi:hypothetical protein